MTALTERNAMVKEARMLGIEKPHTMKNDALKAAIADAKAERAAKKEADKAAGDPFDEIDPATEGDHLTDTEDTLQDVIKAREATREAWLLSAIELLIPVLAQAGASNLRNRQISVSVGFPARTIRKTIGQCWATKASEDGKTSHLFISPLLDNGVQVLGVLAHELIHCDDDCESQHAGHFRKVATAFGLTGKMTATTVGEDLEPVLKDMLSELGEYPHVKLNLGEMGIKKQGTRMLKVECSEADCECGGYTVRTTQKWIEIGMPKCPAGTEMAVAE